MKAGRQCRLAIAWLANALAITVASAQEAVPAKPASSSPFPAVAEAERVIVTGSNIPTAEEVGPAPVDTYSTEDIEKLGARTSTDLVQRIPAITGGAVNQNINNGGDGRTEVNLRGLFPKETLVLVDGKRVAPVGFAMGASVDINLIPWPLVDHVDILKDGASAIYGSDAIGGVFNIFLRHKFHGVEIEASYGNTNLGASNDAAEREAYLLAGTGDGKTELVIFASYYDRDAIFSRDRDISSSANFTRFNGQDTRSGNFAGRVGRFVLRPGLNSPAPHSAADPSTDPDYVALRSIPINKRFFDFARLTAAIPEADRQYYYGSLTHQFLDDLVIGFADFKFARSFFKQELAPVPFAPDAFFRADGVTTITPFGAGFSVPLQNPFNPFTQPSIDPTTGLPATLADGTPVVLGVRYRALEAPPRIVKTDTYDYLYDGGLRGNLGKLGDYFKNWNYEAGFRYNIDQHDQLVSGIVSAPALRAALLDTNPLTAFNPFGRNLNRPEQLNRVLVTTEEYGEATLTDEYGLLNGDLAPLPAGPVSFALGTEHRHEAVNDNPDPLYTSFSSIGAANLQATHASRDVWACFGELRIPITSPGLNIPGLRNLELQLAERFEFYSDTDRAERPKFSIRYQPFDSSLTLRATYTEAFHAPNLSDLAPSAEEEGAELFDPALPPGSDPVDVRVLTGGQPNLRPEVAYGWNYGFVYSPKFLPGLTLSVDYYHIDLRDRTSNIDTQFIIDQNFFSNGRKFPGQVVRDPTTNQLLLVHNLTQNIARTITEGIDYELVYIFDTSVLNHGSLGTLTFFLNGNYVSRYVASIDVGDNEHEYAGGESGFAGYLPHHRFYTSLFYDYGGLDAGVTVHYIGQGNDLPFSTRGDQKFNPPPPDPFPRKIREWTTVDGLISYTFNFSGPGSSSDVPGLSRDASKNGHQSKESDATPVSSLENGWHNWRWWLSHTTITAGMNNILDADPPFAAGGFTFENGYDESTFDLKGRYWYVALKKRF